MATSTLSSSAAVLLVKDVFAAANHYRDKLGFGYDGFFGEPPSFCILQRDNCHLMLAQLGDPTRIAPHWKIRDKTWNVYSWVTDADAFIVSSSSAVRLSTTVLAISLMDVASLASRI
jgi:hypothetical protein